MNNIDLEEDAKPQGDLSALSAMSQRLIELKEKEKDQAEILKEIKGEIMAMESRDLPALMDELGVKEFILVDGSQITVNAVIRASIPALGSIRREKDPDKKAELQHRYNSAIAYLRNKGAGSLVRNTLTADLGKDSDDFADKAVHALAKIGIKSSCDVLVNAQSLSAWVREKIASGNELDHDLLAVYSGQQAKLKPAKK